MNNWEMFGGQAHVERASTLVPPLVISVPSSHQIPTEDLRPLQFSALSKMLKEARYLGCGNFDGTSDAMVAKNWLKRM